MKFSDHALLRFTQRVLGIKDEQKARKFIKTNKYEVYYKLLKLVNESEVLLEGFAPDKTTNVVYDYLLNDQILIVIANKQQLVVTLYDVKLDLDQEMNHVLLTKNLKLIRKNKHSIHELETKRKKNDRVTRALEGAIEFRTLPLHSLQKKHESNKSNSIRLAAQSKQLREKNREVMTEIMYGFKKFLN